MEKILVYGAGVLGSLYAARLQDAGHDVTVLARGARLSTLREQGIILEDARTGARTTTRVNVVDRLAPDDDYDLVLVVVCKNEMASVLPALAANRHTPQILFLGNNAAGPGALVDALGRDRVLLGFPGAGGVCRDGRIRYVGPSPGHRIGVTTIGELDGTTTLRLQDLAEMLDEAGFPVALCPNMDSWLKSHFAVIGPLAGALYLAGGDNYRLARTRDGLVLAVRGIQEGFRVLRALGIPILPPRLRILAGVPEPLLVAYLRRVLATPEAEIAIAGHAAAARAELNQLAAEFRVLIRRADVPTPALDRLVIYLDPAVPTVPEGSALIRLDWSAVWTGLGTLLGTLLGLALLRRKVAHRAAPAMPLLR